MKISFPLSLKFSLWLLLNLLLLGAIALGFLIAQGGFGWDSLMRGPPGKRAQDLGNVIVGEFMAANGDAARRGVLERFGASYGTQFFLIHPRVPGATRSAEGLPAPVSERAGPMPGMRGEGRGPGPEADFAMPGPPGELGPPPGGGGGPPSELDQARGRFLVHTSGPSAFWIGVRVPIDRPLPAVLVARIDSWWGLMRVLDLQAWLLAGSAIVVFSVLFWLPFVRGVTHSLRELTTATGQIAEGNFNTRVPEKRRDEIGALGGSVNRMAARLDTLVNGQRRFLADIAHELGSPIGRLQVATEILEMHASPALQGQVADVREEVQQMSALVNELLAFTKAGLRPREADLATVELAPLVTRVITREDTAGKVVLDVPAELRTRADAELLERAVANLVRNALRYASGAGPITLTAGADHESVAIAVADEGPGVPPEALARLGEPFYRPEDARTRETGGNGLGLAIVKSCVLACRGTVAFRNRAPRGFEAEIRLALA